MWLHLKIGDTLIDGNDEWTVVTLTTGGKTVWVAKEEEVLGGSGYTSHKLIQGSVWLNEVLPKKRKSDEDDYEVVDAMEGG